MTYKRMLESLIDGYMAQRATLIARLIQLQQNNPPEYYAKLKDLRTEIDKIDQILVGSSASPVRKSQQTPAAS